MLFMFFCLQVPYLTAFVLVSFILRQDLTVKPWLQFWPLTQRDIPASASKVLEVKACTTSPSLWLCFYCWITFTEYFGSEVVFVAAT